MCYKSWMPRGLAMFRATEISPYPGGGGVASRSLRTPSWPPSPKDHHVNTGIGLGGEVFGSPHLHALGFPFSPQLQMFHFRESRAFKNDPLMT